MIPYGRQTIEEDDIQAVVEVLKSDYLTTGPKIAEFEGMVADYVGVKYAVAISNGTSALHAACFAAGIGKGDEVITTPLTFAASANCVLYCGGTPVFADVDPDTFVLTAESIILIRQILKEKSLQTQKRLLQCIWQDNHVIWMQFMKLQKNIICL